MPKEIERKFLVSGDGWRDAESVDEIRQGYLSDEKERTVRVRIRENSAWLTIKGKTEGVSRAEYEYSIPRTEAQEMLENLCLRPLIEKRRHVLSFGGYRWEVDEFFGANDGLIVAEVELPSEDAEFAKPEWVGKEVSDDPRYYNANLIELPFCDWD